MPCSNFAVVALCSRALAHTGCGTLGHMTLLQPVMDMMLLSFDPGNGRHCDAGYERSRAIHIRTLLPTYINLTYCFCFLSLDRALSLDVF